MRSPHSATTRQWADARKRRQVAAGCGEPERPDARAMFLAGGSLRHAQEFEAAVAQKRKQALIAEDRRLRAESEEREAQDRMDALYTQQAERLARGELTPESITEHRERIKQLASERALQRNRRARRIEYQATPSRPYPGRVVASTF